MSSIFHYIRILILCWNFQLITRCSFSEIFLHSLLEEKLKDKRKIRIISPFFIPLLPSYFSILTSFPFNSALLKTLGTELSCVMADIMQQASKVKYEIILFYQCKFLFLISPCVQKSHHYSESWSKLNWINFSVSSPHCRFLPMSDDEDDVKRTVRSLKDKR